MKKLTFHVILNVMKRFIAILITEIDVLLYNIFILTSQ